MGIVAHGVNCQGVMNSGVARAIRNKWPAAYERYASQPTGKAMLGTTQLVEIDGQALFVANCYTQIFYGKGGRFADPEAIDRCLSYVYNAAAVYDLPVYLPRIGCGLGGLSWQADVEPLVSKYAQLWEPRIQTFVCDI